MRLILRARQMVKIIHNGLETILEINGDRIKLTDYEQHELETIQEKFNSAELQLKNIQTTFEQFCLKTAKRI